MRQLTSLAAYRDDDGNEIRSETAIDNNISIVFRGSNNRIEVGPNARLDRLAVTFDCDNGTLLIGANRRVHGGNWVIRVGQDATVAIGNNVSTTNPCVISAVEGVTVRIGNDVMIASNVQIRADDGHPIFDVRSGLRVNPSRPITIGNHVWLGLGSSILAGSDIGDGTVVGLGAVVAGRLPNNCVAVGAPARVIRRDIAWERPHLSFVAPPYKPDASTVRKSERYWNLTVDMEVPQAVRTRLRTRLAVMLRRWRRTANDRR